MKRAGHDVTDFIKVVQEPKICQDGEHAVREFRVAQNRLLGL
jgi:hypothetical protein